MSKIKYLYNDKKFINRALLENLKRALDVYFEFYQNKQFYIELSNSDVLCIKIMNKHLPHILGLNQNDELYKKILLTCGIEYHHINLYEFINFLGNNIEDVVLAIKNENIDDSFLKKLSKRSHMFWETENLEHVDYVVCKHELTKEILAKIPKEKSILQSNYFLVKDSMSEYKDYNVMGINMKKDNPYVETMLLFGKDNLLFEKQIMTIPKKIITVTNNKEYIKQISLKSQLYLIKKYISIIKANDMTVDLSATPELIEEVEKLKIKIK